MYGLYRQLIAIYEGENPGGQERMETEGEARVGRPAADGGERPGPRKRWLMRVSVGPETYAKNVRISWLGACRESSSRRSWVRERSFCAASHVPLPRLGDC